MIAQKGLGLVRPLLALRSIKTPRLGYATIPSEAVVIADNGTVVCWHPEQHFPYEFTKPLPVVEADDSMLSDKAKEAMAIFRRKHPEAVRGELAKMTFTTKHRWYPRGRDKRAKKTLPDREYL